jgi:hypothetical protein
MSISEDFDVDAPDRLASVQVPKFSHLRQDANPMLAAHMLQEMYRMVAQWQQELQEIERQSLEITASGPVLAAWLETQIFKPGTTGKSIPTPYQPIDPVELITVNPLANYRLCGLDEEGKLWTRPCSTAELSNVRSAVIRYQQLRALTERQSKIERHLRQILEDLVHLRLKLED